MSPTQAIAILRSNESTLRRHGVASLALFGSTARGRAGPGSDIDLVIDPSAADFSLFDQLGVKYLAEELLGGPVDVVVRRCLNPRVRAHMAADAIVVF
jgi:uncharacterized protein